MKKNLFLTGASGLLGYEIAMQAKDQFDITGLYQKHKTPEHIFSVQGDISDFDFLKKALDASNPDFIIHTAAISNTAICEKEVDFSYNINVAATVFLCAYAASKNIPFVFTSTDLVFDGGKGNYVETAIPNPLNNYAAQKVLAEQQILEIYSAALICRMPLLIGHREGYTQGYVHAFLEGIQQEKTQYLFVDEYRTPLLISEAARGILYFLHTPVSGILHLGGTEKLNRYELGMLLAEKYQAEKKNLKPAKQADLNLQPPRPADVSLNSNKAFSLGFNPKKLY